MARVPYTGVPDAGVTPAGPAGNVQNIQATPSDFGAQIGAAESGLGRDVLAAGNMLGAQAVQTQERYNQVAVQEAYNNVEKKYFDLTYKVNPANPTDPNTNGIYALQGKDAMNAYQPTLDAMEAIRAETMGGLRNDAQRIAFQETSRRLQYLTQTTIGRHVDNQMRTWNVATEKAGAGNAAASIGVNPGDPSNLASGVADMRTRYWRASAATHGQAMSPELTEAAFRDADTYSVISAVDGFLRQNNPVAAQKFLEDGVLPPRIPGQEPIPVKQAIDPTHHQAQLERVKTLADQNQAASAAGREYRSLVGTGVRGAPLADTSLHSEAQKFLPVLSMGEGNYGSPAPTGDSSGRAWGNNRYQFLARTWDEQAPLAGVDVNDKSPAAQDRVAWNYAANTYRAQKGRDLQADIREGGHEQDIASALNKVWPSLPGGKEQNTTMDQFMARMRGPTLPTTNDAAEPISGNALDNALRRIDANPNLSDKAKEAAKSQLITQTSQYHHVLELNAQAAIDDYTTRILKDKTSVTVDQISNDRRLNGHQKIAMVNELARAQLGTSSGPGPKFTELFQRIHTDDPGTRIKSPSELIPYLGNGLTFMGLGELRKEFAGTGTAQGEYIKTAKTARLAEAKALIIPEFLSTPQDKINYQRAVEAAYQQAAQDEADGVPPAKTWGPDGSVAKVMKQYQGKRANWTNSSLIPPTGEAPSTSAPAPTPPPVKPPLVVGRSYVPDGAGWFKEVPVGTPNSRPYAGRPGEAGATSVPQAPH